LLAGREPSAGLSSFNRILIFLNANKVRDLVNHSPSAGRIFYFYALMQTLQAKAMHASQLSRTSPEFALNQR
jgi:hypothetical protein